MNASLALPLVTAPSIIDLQQFADLLEVSTIETRLELGSAIVYKVQHPERGSLVLVNTVAEAHAVLQC